jgi:hypothetical protein
MANVLARVNILASARRVSAIFTMLNAHGADACTKRSTLSASALAMKTSASFA